MAIWILKEQMDGCSKLNTPSVREIAKDLGVSIGTAQKGLKVAEANDSELNEALADKEISLDQAAKLANLPKEKRKAALEAPLVKSEPKADDRDIRIADLGLREGLGDDLAVDAGTIAVVIVGCGFDHSLGEDAHDVPLAVRPDQQGAAVTALVDDG